MKFFKSILLWVLFTTALLGAPTFPALNGLRVMDEAGLFSALQKASLENTLALYEQNTTNQIVVVTLKSLQGYDISDYGYQLGRHWGIGTKEHNNGIVIIIAPNERKTRIEVGYGLEGVVPDAIAKTIIDTVMLPEFKQGAYYEGTTKGISALMGAIKGEYKAPKQKKKKNQQNLDSFFFPLLFFIFVIVQSMFSSGKSYKTRLIPALSLGAISGGISWFLFSTLGLSIVIAFIAFLMTLFGVSFGGGSGHSSGGSWSSSGGSYSSSSSSDSFSGGGGSFGGGGASGDW